MHTRAALGNARSVSRLPIGAAVAAAVILVGLAGARSLAASSTLLLGNQDIEASNDSDAAGTAEAFRAVAEASGVASTLSLYIGSGSASTRIVAGLYASNSTDSHPAALLAQGALAAPVRGAWNTITLDQQAQLTAGATYWIALLSPGGAGTVAFRDVVGGGASETSASSALTALPSAWTTGATYKDGPLSAYASAALAPDTTPPSAPTGLTTTAVGETSATLSWTASTDDTGVVGYDVYRAATKVATSSTTSYTYTGLACGTSYNFAVDAYDAAGNVSAQAATTATTTACPDTTPPSAPGNLSETNATTGSISFAWVASTDNVGVAGYDVYVNGSLETQVTGTSATVSNLACGSSVAVAVDAYDAAGNRSQEVTTQMSTQSCPPDTTPPSAPGNLTVDSATADGITVSWTASSDDTGVAGYGLYLDGAQHGMTDVTTATFSMLACGTSFTIGVDAFDSAGNTSSTSTVMARTAPCGDTTPPTVSITAPASGSTVSGTVAVDAAASDNVGVVGVQFKLDGQNLGAEVTAAPYGTSWSADASSGTHVLTAVARDAAGNTATSAPVTVTVAAAPSQPVPVPSAAVAGVTVGPGFDDATQHQVVRTKSGTVYIVAADDNPCQLGGSGVIRVWKGSGAQAADPSVPTAFTEMDPSHHPVSGGTGVCEYSGGTSSALFSPDCRLDSNGTIHIVYIDTYNRDVYYQTFSTATDTWGQRVVVGTYGSKISGSSWPRGSQAVITLDAADTPHVAYATYGSSNEIEYTDRVSGSWSAPVTIASGTNEMHPSLTTAPDGSIHLVWLDDAESTSVSIKYDRYADGSWSGVETVSAGDAGVLPNTSDDQGPSVAVDASGRPYVAYLDGTAGGTNDYVRVRYRTSSGWIDDSPPGSAGGAPTSAGTLFAHAPQIYLSQSGDPYVFLGHDAQVSPGVFVYQRGGVGNPWSAAVQVDPRNETNTTAGAPGIDGSASTRYDPLRDNAPGVVDLLYYDENDGTPGYYHHATLYYKAIELN
jgi:chitodextrinase